MRALVAALTLFAAIPRARDSDTDRTREAAIRNLGRQAGAEVEGWSGERVARFLKESSRFRRDLLGDRPENAC